MVKKTLIAVLAAAVLAGCSQAALDRAKHFFFEVPDDAPAQAEAQPAATANEPPELTLPGPRYASVHHPVTVGKCDRCHQTTGLMTVRDDLADACRGCHPRFFTDAIEHGPAADGECRSCHTLHRSELSHLLVAPAGETCLDCHDSAEELSEEDHAGPQAEQCTRCHDPHFGESPYLKTADLSRPAANAESPD